MKIQTIYDKGSGLINEDALLAETPLFGVFDGATGLEPFLNEQGLTGAALASIIARDIFATNPGTLTETANEANTAISEAMRKSKIDTSRKTALWSTTAAVIKIHDKNFDWVQVADSLILTISHDGSFRLLVTDYDHDLESLLMWQELAKQQQDDVWNLMFEQNRKVRNRANMDYGVLNGDPGMNNFLRQGSVSLNGLAHIILFSDGLILPKEDPREPDDFETFVKLFLEGGLEKVKNHVRAMEDSDPKCWRYPRFKQHDDIAAIALTF